MTITRSIHKWLGLFCLATLIATGSLVSAQEEITFSGTFNTSSEIGLWFMSCGDTGDCLGISWYEDDVDYDIYRLQGSFTGDRLSFNMESTGFEFYGGIVDPDAGFIQGGLWTDPFNGVDLTWRWEGWKTSQVRIEDAYLGEFAGTYVGSGDSGTWVALIFADGHIEGELRSDSATPGDPSLTIAGGITPQGIFFWEAKHPDLDDRLVMKGTVAGNTGYITGETWRNTLTDDTGTFAGQRDDAFPLDVLDPGGGGQSNCFINSIAK